jgi:hypothetical protein
VSRKRPIIRPGQRKPYTKATRREIGQRIKAATILEDAGWERSSIDWFFEEVFGIESRQIARYLALARVREAHERGFTGGYNPSS